MDSAIIGREDKDETIQDWEDLGITNEELFQMTSKDLNRLLKQKGIPDSRRRKIRKHRRSKIPTPENRHKIAKNRHNGANRQNSKNRENNENRQNGKNRTKIDCDN